MPLPIFRALNIQFMNQTTFQHEDRERWLGIHYAVMPSQTVISSWWLTINYKENLIYLRFRDSMCKNKSLCTVVVCIYFNLCFMYVLIMFYVFIVYCYFITISKRRIERLIVIARLKRGPMTRKCFSLLFCLIQISLFAILDSIGFITKVATYLTVFQLLY